MFERKGSMCMSLVLTNIVIVSMFGRELLVLFC